MAKAILNRKASVGSLTIARLKSYSRAIVIKTGCSGTKDTSTSEIKYRTGKIKAFSYIHPIFDKDVIIICWRKDFLFNKQYWENRVSRCRRIKLEPYLSS